VWPTAQRAGGACRRQCAVVQPAWCDPWPWLSRPRFMAQGHWSFQGLFGDLLFAGVKNLFNPLARQ